MSGINKAIIVGRMGQDPEVRYAANGNAVANLSIATSKKYQGNEETEWHRIVCFGKLATVCQEWVKKGDLIGIEGEIRTRKWQDQSGHDRYSTEIICHNLNMLGSKNTNTAAPREPAQERPATQTPAQASESEAAPLDDGFDDIPF
jgi:single-strand DNA-binding protein